MQVKKKLNDLTNRAPHVNEGDIWWISVGENVGSEIDGKSRIFSRPAIIYKKLAHGFYLIVPTTKKKSGSWYVTFRHQGVEMCACLHQIRTVDYRRLWSKMGRMDEQERKKVEQGFYKLYFKHIPRAHGPGSRDGLECRISVLQIIQSLKPHLCSRRGFANCGHVGLMVVPWTMAQ